MANIEGDVFIDCPLATCSILLRMSGMSRCTTHKWSELKS
jgi:hypothetical protein